MTWPETANFFDELLVNTIVEFTKRGHLIDPATIEPQPSSEEYQAALNEEIDNAVKYFAKNYSWPKNLSKPAMHHCVSRIQQACELVKFVFQQAEKLPQNHQALQSNISDKSLTAWLLTDYWNNIGIWREIFRCSSFTPPNS